jgi:pyruvate phosphate dikinase-like enzyme/lamin tail-like protein
MPSGQAALAINEVMSQNDGAWIDELGKVSDWVEVVNRSDSPLRLADHWLEDGSGRRTRLGGGELGPGERRVLWADGDDRVAAGHLPFKLKSSGDRLVLSDAAGRSLDEVTLPALSSNEVLARFPDGSGALGVCRYASPLRDNGTACVPPDPPSLPDDVSFAPATLPVDYPPAGHSLGLSELALRPEVPAAAFVELENRAQSPLALDGFSVRIATHGPSLPWPGPLDGRELALPEARVLAPGERTVLALSAADVAELEVQPSFEGVVSVFDAASGDTIERVDFMSWPRGASLMQRPGTGLYHYCSNATPGEGDECEPLLSRPVGERLRHLHTPGDYAALAAGGEELGIQSVKFVVDLAAPGLVHLLSSERWPLHYTFIRERIYLEPALDRCNAAQNSEFYRGWSDFSAREYYRVEGRRFLLGTLSHHSGAGINAVEYAYGDVISGEQMRDGFLSAVAHTADPGAWVLHPQDDEQARKVRQFDGRLPMVGPNAPFEGVTYQPLTTGVSYGTLRFVPASELGAASLGPDVILVTDDVPNDIPLVGGLVTEAFQTPLAHVNVLSQNRGTPNASLKNARLELEGSLDQLVRIEVAASGLTVTPADPEEARAFWQARLPARPSIAARLDTSVRGVQPLDAHDLASLPAIGAKAAQLAQLGRGRAPWCGNLTVIRTPETPFAVPLVHSLEHLERSGARALLDELEADAAFVADPQVRARGLARVRELIQAEPVEEALLAEVEAAVRSRFGSGRVRFRSSSNTEDLPGFNGAGLYTSLAAELGDDSRRVEDALRGVWASLYNARAYDERAYAHIDERSVAMGVLVHAAFPDEQANGVAVSRNLLEPTRGDIYYVNAQLGEASVTNPAPGVTTEQLVYRWGREPPILYQSASSLLGALNGPPSQALTAEEVVDLSCALRTVHELFEPLLNADGKNPWFAMEVEYKLLGPARQLLIKQARPHSFGTPTLYGDCREL